MTGDESKEKSKSKARDTQEQVREKMKELLKEMQEKIKELQEKINNLKEEILPKEDKEKRLNEFKGQVKKMKEEYKEKIDSLENKAAGMIETTLDSLENKAAGTIETTLDSLENQINLGLAVLKNTDGSEVSGNIDEGNDEKKKGFFTRTKDWFLDNWKKLTNKEGGDKEARKKALRVVGGVGLIGGVAWIGSKIFNRYDYEQEIPGYNEMSNKEKRKARRKLRKDKRKEKRAKRKEEIKKLPFWDRPLGKILKGTAIGAAAVGGVYGILKLLGLAGKKDKVDGRSSDEDKLNGYEEEIVNKPENKEKFENYEAFGENIDLLYGSIYDRELKAGYEDELEMQKIAKEQSNEEKYFKGVVPYCLDNQFKNVDNILGQNSSMKQAIANGLHGMINYIKSKGNDFLQIFVNTYLDKLPSWLPFKNAAGSLSDKIDQWKEKNTTRAEKEMQYFFRQSIRIQTYLFEKRDQLIQKIVKESSAKFGISEKDILGDDENFKKYVLDIAEYQNFINGSISSAVTVLRNYKIFDCEISKEKKEDIEELDKQRNEVLGCNEGEKDILVTINEKKEKGEALTHQDEKKLGEACDGIIKDIDDNILDAVNKSAWTIYEDLLGFNDSYLRKYLDKSGLEKVFREYKQIIAQKKLELQGGKLSNEDKIALAESINAMLALKKEAVLGSQTIEKDYDENGNILYRILGFLWGSVKNLEKSVEKLCHKEFLSSAEYLLSVGLGTGVIITSAGIFAMLASKGRYGAGAIKRGAKITVLPVGVTYQGLTTIKPIRDAVDKIHYPCKFWGKNGPKKLIDLLKDGKISLSRASEIVEGNTFSTVLLKDTEERRKDFFKVSNEDKGVVSHKVFNRLVAEISDTPVGGPYVQSIIKSDIYEKLVKNYDISKEIRQAISESKSLEQLIEVIEQPNVKNLLKITEDLELQEIKIKNGRRLSGLSIAETKQLERISDFRKALTTMEDAELQRTVALLGEFKKGGDIGDAISQLTVLRKLEGKVVDMVDDAGKPITKNLDDIVKNMNPAELRMCKGKISGVADDAIESLAKIFENVRVNAILKFSDNIDEIGKTLKVLFKLVAKAT